tara:strand:+ start:4040 stop:4300 length:261 start_codon:yes stop_codon:yes gene_type:complete
VKIRVGTTSVKGCPYIARYKVGFLFLCLLITPLTPSYKYNYDKKEWAYVKSGDRYKYNVATDTWEYKNKNSKTKYNIINNKWSLEE